MMKSLVNTGRKRTFAALPHKVLISLAALFAIGVIYGNLFVISDPLIIGILFLSALFSMLFLVVGATTNARDKPTIIDWVLSALSLATGVFFLVNASVISSRITLLEELTPAQLFFGSSLLFLSLAATRRTTGAGLTIVVLGFMAYNLFGHLLPPPFGHGVIEYTYLLDALIFTTDGVFGVPIQVVASYVFLFVLFGTLLSFAGGGDFFFNLAASLTGKSPGGPAKVAVISSGMYGTISGSPVSDVVATGSITIPIMKRLGYSSRFAGAVEVAASTGGSAMPPIMGSAAFILAEYTGFAYREVVYAAIIPAILYYLGVFSQVHFRAVKRDLRSYPDDVPTLKATLINGWMFIVPIAVIILALSLGYSPTMTAGLGAASVVIAAACSARTRMSVWRVVEGLGETTLRILPVAGACAAAGLVIGGLSMTGLGMKAANVIMTISGADPVITLMISAVVTIILGLGMPTPSAYILAAVLVGPALSKLGYPLLESHMFLLYYAILSALTPPIAVAALAAAAIAEEDPFKIAFDAVKLAAVGFLLPFVFIWNPAIIGSGSSIEIGLAVIGGVIGTISLAAAIEGYMNGTLSRLMRSLFICVAVSSVAPYMLVSLGAIVVGCALLARNYFSTSPSSAKEAKDQKVPGA